MPDDVQPGRNCPRCPRLAAFRATWRAKEPEWFNAPVPSFGSRDARLLIVGLAPGLQGANRTGRPFTGDYAGVLLYDTLGKYGFAKGEYAAHPDDGLRLCCKQLMPSEDLTYRHGMIALFDAAPKTGNVAVRRSVEIAYCVYRSADRALEQDLPWISIGTEVAASDAEKWVFRNHERQIHTWTNAPDVLARLIASGAGRGVLPVFVGDAMPALVREGSVIEDLTHPLWLAVNDDDRHRPEMRLAIDRLSALFKRHEDRFAGRPVEARSDLRPAARS